MDKQAASKLNELQRMLLGVLFIALWSTFFMIFYTHTYIYIYMNNETVHHHCFKITLDCKLYDKITAPNASNKPYSRHWYIKHNWVSAF
jgi:hypothetical protein